MNKVVNKLKQIFTRKGSQQPQGKHEPVIISRQNHRLSRRHISNNALKILYRLHKSGYSAYLVGGSVRDLLLGHTPKDFDIVTNAHPEQIQRLFRNSYIIGRRFRLVHVRFGSEIIEVATFRGSSRTKTEGIQSSRSSKIKTERIQNSRGLLLRDNVYGTLEDDVWRRDFTINALYYNIADFTVLDYTKGMEDLKKGQIRVIGDPESRYREDPARMLRAIRLAAKLNFQIEEHSEAPLSRYQALLTQVPPARLFDKMLKIFHSGKSFQIFELLKKYNVLSTLLPQVAYVIQDATFDSFLEAAFKNTDQRISENKTINSAFLFAVLIWCPLARRKQWYLESGEIKEYEALHLAMTDVLAEQLKIIAISRRLTTVMREIWLMQYYFENLRAKRVYRLFHHPRFRASYDFLGLRSKTVDKHLVDLYQWWTAFEVANDEVREQLIQTRFKLTGRKRKNK